MKPCLLLLLLLAACRAHLPEPEPEPEPYEPPFTPMSPRDMEVPGQLADAAIAQRRGDFWKARFFLQLAGGDDAELVADEANAAIRDTERVTDAGHGFLLPAGWQAHATESAIWLTPPLASRGQLVLVDVDAEDEARAVAIAKSKVHLPAAVLAIERFWNGWTVVLDLRPAEARALHDPALARLLRHLHAR